MGIVELIVYALATWRLTTLLMDEDGPFDILKKLREFLGVNNEESEGFFYKLFNCHWCLSMWTAAAMFLLPFPVAAIFSLSACSVIFHLLVERRYLVA